VTVFLPRDAMCKALYCDGATGNADLDIARPSKLFGLTSRDWTTRDHIGLARVDIARPDNAAPYRRGGQRIVQSRDVQFRDFSVPIAIACCPSVCPFVCNIGWSGPYNLEILETNCADN